MVSLLFGVVFQREVTAAAQVWMDSTAYNHCFLILPLVAYLLWDRRSVISSISPCPVLWPLLLMPALSAIWLVAAVLDIQEGRQLSVVAMFEVVLLVALGPRVFWLLLAPLLFLFFLVPSGAFLVPSLQTITADIAVAGLQGLHIPVFTDGYMIEIPEGNFEIAEACAGLRFLIASSVFGCFFAVVMYRHWLRRALFIVLSVAVPVAANGLRALGIIVLAHLEGSAAAVEADHILYGWVFFSIVIFILTAIGMTFAQKSDRLASVRWTPPPDLSMGRLAIAVPAAALLALSGPAYAARLDSRLPAVPLPQSLTSPVSPPWHTVAPAHLGWRPTLRGADREFLEGFEAPGEGVVIRDVGLYRLRVTGSLFTTTENRLADDVEWHIAEYGRAEANLGGKKVTVRSAEIVSGPRRRLVWSFYLVDGRITAGLLEAKLLKARAVLLAQAPVAALVAISAGMDDPDHPAERRLDRFLAASQLLFEDLAPSR
jgi:exosortase A